MAIEPFVADFHNGTPAAITGKTVNGFQGPGAGQFSSDLLGFDTGAATGVSGSTLRALTANSSGRSAGADELRQEMNAQGGFSSDGGPSPGNNTFTYTFPSTVTSVDVEVLLCTTFADQADLDVTINGSTQTAFDSTGNTTGATLTFTGVVPDGSDQVVILIENQDGTSDNFIFHNGHIFTNIVDAAGAEFVGDLTGVGTATGDLTVPPATLMGDLTGVGTATGDLTKGVLLAGDLTGVGTATGDLTTAPNFVDDTFDGTGALGSHWSTFNGSVIDSGVSRVSNYLEGTVSDNTSERTRWFNTDQGRYDYQTITVPSSGIDEYVLEGVGVGPTGDRLANLTSSGDPFNFCGLMVHDDTLSNIDYMFAVVGHRGTVHATIETKGTVSGVSDPTDEGADEFGAGVTHCDIAVEVDSSGVCKFKTRAIGAGTWNYTNGGTGLVPSNFSMGASGTQFKIGIIGYASGTTGVPFVFTADSITKTSDTLSGDLTSVGTATGDLTTGVLLQGDFTGVGTATGDLTVGATLQGDLTGDGDIVGSVTTGVLLQGDLTGVGTATGDLTTGDTLSGDLTGDGDVAGALTTGVLLTGDFTGDGTATGDLTSLSGLQGDMTGDGDIVGALTTGVLLTGDFTGVGTVAGVLSSLSVLSGDMTGDGTATGLLAGSPVMPAITGKITLSSNTKIILLQSA